VTKIENRLLCKGMDNKILLPCVLPYRPKTPVARIGSASVTRLKPAAPVPARTT